MSEFVFGTFVYKYEIIKQDRKTLSLTVTPDLDIILKCPHKVSEERIENFLRKKWFWLEKQLSFFKKYQRKIYEKEYISGEGYLYLGRQYQLIVKRGKKDSASLTNGQLIVYTSKSISNTQHNKRIINSWFELKAKDIFKERFEEIVEKFGYKETIIFSIREMSRRWGSFLKQDKIFLNPKLIHMPKSCIDYVIVHELCHMKYKNHDKRFFNLLNQKYPKWERIKEKLEILGSMVN